MLIPCILFDNKNVQICIAPAEDLTNFISVYLRPQVLLVGGQYFRIKFQCCEYKNPIIEFKSQNIRYLFHSTTHITHYCSTLGCDNHHNATPQNSDYVSCLSAHLLSHSSSHALIARDSTATSFVAALSSFPFSCLVSRVKLPLQ